VVAADPPAGHPAQQPGGPIFAADAGHARRLLPPTQAHRSGLAIVGGDHRGLVPSPLAHQVLKFYPSLRMPQDDGGCQVEAVTIAQVGVDHSRVSRGFHWVARSFYGDAESILAEIFFSVFLHREKSKSGFNGRRGRKRTRSRFWNNPPWPRRRGPRAR
jgi:hypothetical protein